LFIYQIVNDTTKDSYVGMTKQHLNVRFRRHLSNARCGLNTHLCRAIRKYGEHAFHIDLLETMTAIERSILADREKYWIATIAPEYNMTAGGDGGDTSTSPAYRVGISRRDQAGSKNGMFGRKGSNSPNVGSKRDPVQRERMRSGLQKAWDENGERKEIASRRITGLDNNPGALKTSRPVSIDGKLYPSIGAAHRETGLTEYIIKKRYL
jgi:group I intron endonuclease